MDLTRWSTAQKSMYLHKMLLRLQSHYGMAFEVVDEWTAHMVAPHTSSKRYYSCENNNIDHFLGDRSARVQESVLSAITLYHRSLMQHVTFNTH